MICENGAQTHRPSMQYRLMAKAAETSMPMHNFDGLSNDNVTENGEEREDCWKCGLPVDDKERDMVDFETVGEVSNTSATFVSVCDNYDFMASVDEFL
jgi:hypothetical protein